MSNNETSENIITSCANCGKGEEASNLKSCSACKLVKYCSRNCQIAHRSQHKKACKKRAKELYDEKLFKLPPPLEDCPICMIRLPTLPMGKMYMACCGKVVCRGCIHAPIFDHIGNVTEKTCPFCRTPTTTSDEENLKRLEKRVEMSDPLGIYQLGCYYARGNYGLRPDWDKALELYHRSAELGSAEASCQLGHAYYNGDGVEVDKKKAFYYLELSAVKGQPNARQYLGDDESFTGNLERALKHYVISAGSGLADSLEKIKQLYSYGHATKEDYTKALRSYQANLDEIKSDQRDKAAAVNGKRYY